MDSDTGLAFRAVAELLNVDSDELLQNLVVAYVSSVRQGIMEVAGQYPAFEEKYPFVE